MIKQTSILVTYKGKILLFSKDTYFQENSKNIWSLLDERKVKEFHLSSFKMTKLESPMLHIRLTDENVNTLRRKEGYRLEFYQFSEVLKLNLSDDARILLDQYQDEIKGLLVK